MNSFVKWLTPAISLGVVIFIIFFLLKINAPTKVSSYIPKLHNINYKLSDIKSTSWINSLVKSKRHGYIYPINEIFIHVDLSNEILPKKNYKLTAYITTLYQFFCLKEELQAENLKYFLKNKNNMVELLVYFDSLKKLNLFTKTLKTYNIRATILPFKKEN